jgi:uncharacterized protein (DUF1810 family)
VSETADPYNLDRFVAAQNECYEDVLAELGRGHKSSHWMWFVFPQIAGLGHSSTARRFAISSRDEAKAYLQHEVLGKRLIECTLLVNSTVGLSAEEIFGHPDVLKFRSSMTLFAQCSPNDEVFDYALQKFFAGKPDPQTLALL